MAVTLIHGEQLSLSRQKLIELLQSIKVKGIEVITLPAKNLQLPDLEVALGGNNLFGGERVVVIEELHSLPISARRKALIEMIAQAENQIILWEKKSVTKTQVKALNAQPIFEFKPSPVLFKWLDSFSADPKTKPYQLKLLHEAAESEGADMCFILLIRQVKLLIQAKTDAPIAGPPFVVSKIKGQSRAFTLEKLLSLHTKLLEIDQKQKTSKLLNSLTAELDLLILRM